MNGNTDGDADHRDEDRPQLLWRLRQMAERFHPDHSGGPDGKQ